MFHAIGDRVINLSLVREVEPLAKSEGGISRCRLHFDDKHKVIVPVRASYFDGRLGSIVPAPDGYMLVVATVHTPEGGQPEDHYTHIPVLAFRVVGGSDVPIPITCNGEPDEGSPYALVLPDGKCLAGGCDLLPTLDAWKAEIRSDAQSSGAVT